MTALLPPERARILAAGPAQPMIRGMAIEVEPTAGEVAAWTAGEERREFADRAWGAVGRLVLAAVVVAALYAMGVDVKAHWKLIALGAAALVTAKVAPKPARALGAGFWILLAVTEAKFHWLP